MWTVIAASIALLVGAAGAQKLWNPVELMGVLVREFHQDVNTAAKIARVIGIAELVIATMLIIPLARRTGFIACACLLSIFTSFLVFQQVHGSTNPCGCGVGLQSGDVQYDRLWGIAQNLVLLSVSLMSCKPTKLGGHS